MIIKVETPSPCFKQPSIQWVRDTDACYILVCVHVYKYIRIQTVHVCTLNILGSCFNLREEAEVTEHGKP